MAIGAIKGYTWTLWYPERFLVIWYRDEEIPVPDHFNDQGGKPQDGFF